MNPLTLTARHMRVDGEVRLIREAWPHARITLSSDRTTATVVIEDAGCVTYIIEVTPDGSRSMWIKHAPDGSGQTAGWRDGWVD